MEFDSMLVGVLKRGPPWAGASDFSRREMVRLLGGRWNSAERRWMARDVETLRALTRSGAWLPADVPAFCSARFLAILDADILEKAEEQKLGKTVVPAKKDTVPEKKASNQHDIRVELQIPADEPELLVKLTVHGVTPAQVTATAAWPILGPRSGISDARRLLRGARFGIVNLAELDKPDETRPSTRRVQRRKHKESAAPQPVEEQPRGMPGKWWMAEAFAHKAECMACKTLLDSRKQFGLECLCPTPSWRACGRCLAPSRDFVCGACIALDF